MPRLWLMTDERMGEGLWDALARLPRGAGVVFRHYATPPAERRALFERIRRIARRRRLTLLVTGDALPGADGIHGRTARRSHGLLSRPVHSRIEAIAAARAGADLIFVSPVFPTRSHPGARTLGPVRLGLMLRGIEIPAVALGGMDARGFRRLGSLRLHGWAAIDAWMPKPKSSEEE
ncbi:thiamine phosphate synthase [Sphingomonas gilva]|nr:thiamine phosphate synthase [Sphingomonas gilva]